MAATTTFRVSDTPSPPTSQPSFFRSLTPPQSGDAQQQQQQQQALVLLSAPPGGVVGGAVHRSSNNSGGATPPPPPEQAKFKTTICRNWESSGGCQFRNCTFAHGVDDLRAPGSALASGSGNSPLSSPIMGGQSTPSTVGASLSNNNSFNSSHTSAVYDAASARSDTFVDSLLGDVGRLRSLHQLQQDANRTLEIMLAREQAGYRETCENIRQLRQEIATMEEEVALKGKGGGASASESTTVLLAAAGSSSNSVDSVAVAATPSFSVAADQQQAPQQQQQQTQQEDVRALLQSLGTLQ